VPWPGSNALDAEDAAGGLFDLAAALGAKLRLSEIGLRESDLDRAADLAAENPYPNPTPITRERIRALLDDAFYGHGQVWQQQGGWQWQSPAWQWYLW
jgi:maleylacetate reductase